MKIDSADAKVGSLVRDDAGQVYLVTDDDKGGYTYCTDLEGVRQGSTPRIFVRVTGDKVGVTAYFSAGEMVEQVCPPRQMRWAMIEV